MGVAPNGCQIRLICHLVEALMSFKPMLPAGELDQLAEAAGTDKSSKTHDYMWLYEFVFAP